MNWSDLLAALALVLVIEGMVPFISPQTLRKLQESMAQLDDKSLRNVGLASMICGAVLLYLVRH